METYLIQIGKDELQKIIADAVKLAIPQDLSGAKLEAPIKGIHELAKFLRISPARAQKLKNEGVFQYFQDGRTVLFDPAKVRLSFQGLSKKVRV